ncbi:MAG TPA: cytochrome P450 [Actinophytocola sp.]|jgi:cytochrome P450|uniref:cytochrome P450 n=1 Tax=Actinophytocola sp. TaxID=1872138 RepID=UPI002E0B1484|nr:cytochrome P450 [Actinophytocola sp.]
MTTIGSGVLLAELDADPYPTYARLRRAEPVCWLPEVRQWLVTTWADASRVLADPGLFTTDIPESPMVRFCGGRPMLLREGTDHRDIREAFRHDYDPHRVSDYVDTVVRPHAERIAARLARAGRAELVGEYFEPVAAASEATLLGIGPSGANALRRWAGALAAVATNLRRDRDIDAYAADTLAEGDVLSPVVARLRERPNGSVISHLIHANRAGGRPDADILPVLKHVAMCAIEPGWLAGWTLLALLSRPEQLEEVRGDRWLLGAAVYEVLRWSAPVGTVTRRTTAPVSLHGKDLPAGATLIVSIASANRDESAFPDADVFDLHRPVRTHLGFGTGPHRCPAFAFAVAGARTALDVLLDRMPGLRPDVDWWPAPHGWKFRLPGPIAMRWGRVL